MKRYEDYSSVADHYLSLLAHVSWLRVEQCWAVVVPSADTFSDQELAGRLSLGGSYEIKTGHIGEFGDERVNHISRAWFSRAASLFEIGYHASRTDVLAKLSEQAHVHSVFWNVEANNSLNYAANGRPLLTLDIFEKDEWSPAVREAFPELEVFDVVANQRAAALCFMELRSGVRLTAEWLNAKSEGFVFSWFPHLRQVRQI